MSALVLIGLVAACAKLWLKVGALRDRIAALEGAAEPTWYPDVVAPVRTSAQVIQALPADVVDARPDPAPVVEAFAPQPPLPPLVEEPLPAPSVEEPVDLPKVRGGFEDLFGRKLPIWAGGITLAVAGFLIVKYSFDSGLLSPFVRVIMGLLFGSALIAGAEVALRTESRVRDPRVRQALAGAGIATLYACILAAANLYHLVGPMSAFAGMALTTILAGGLSLRFGAPSALLGLVGGLAAPALVGSGTPDVPLLSAYLALTVGGLCALSRNQRWMWLGVAALVGGFGWGALLLLGGAFDLADTLAIGSYTLLLGLGLPLVAFAGQRRTMVRLAGSLAACAQLAALVAIGGFAPLEWALFGLVSVALVWLSRREPALAELPAAGLAVALLLVVAWPDPSPALLASVLAAMVTIYGLAAAYRVWRSDWRASDAIQVAVLSAAIVALPALRLPLSDDMVASLSLLGATLSAIVASLGWTVTDRRRDTRFAILTTTAGALAAVATIVLAPSWTVAPALGVIATGMLLLANRAEDPRLDWVAAVFGAVAVLALPLIPDQDLRRAIGIAGLSASPAAMLSWLVPALAAIAFVHGSRRAEIKLVAQPIAVLLGYVAIAQIMPTALLPLIPVILLPPLALTREYLAALATAAVLTTGWAALPLATWLMAAGAAVLGMPLLVGALPPLDDTFLRLVLPAAAAVFVGWRAPHPVVRQGALIAAAILATVSIHIAFKQVFAIADLQAFVRLGMAERTLWEMLLAAAALALWQRRPLAGHVLAAASVAHFAWFTLLLHDPLWALQAVGNWPIANLLLPAFGTAFLLTWSARRLPLPPWAIRAREWVQMVLILAFAAATLPQAFHGSILSGPLNGAENITRSVVLIAMSAGFLRHGIVAGSRDWRIASLVLMLVAVGKVFLVDAAGLDGLLRIASFAALGFSLIGVGWLYARFLPEDAVLTPDSEMAATPNRGI
jgi:uncharacterized membrane protein